MSAPDSVVPAIDPEGWITRHNYAGQLFSVWRDGFLNERRNSIASLEAFTKTNWEQSVHSEHLVGLTAADMVWAWVTHDVLHIRQLSELRYAMIASQAGTHQIGYAGEW